MVEFSIQVEVGWWTYFRGQLMSYDDWKLRNPKEWDDDCPTIDPEDVESRLVNESDAKGPTQLEFLFEPSERALRKKRQDKRA